MKKAIRISVSLLVMIMAVSSFSFGQVGFSFGQDVTKISKTKQLQFNKETEKVEITISTSKAFNKLSIQLNAQLLYGEAKFEIVDPKGKTRANFTIKTDDQNTNVKSTTITRQATGNLTKSFINPIIGDWKIRISPAKAIIGTASIMYDQAYYLDIKRRTTEQIMEIDPVDIER